MIIGDILAALLTSNVMIYKIYKNTVNKKRLGSVKTLTLLIVQKDNWIIFTIRINFLLFDYTQRTNIDQTKTKKKKLKLCSRFKNKEGIASVP